MNEQPSPVSRPRLWPLLAIVTLAVGVWLCLWFVLDLTRSYRVAYTGVSLGLAILLTVVWLLFFSRLTSRAKSWSLGLPALALAAFFAVFKVEDVDGDFMPSFTWRWAAKPHELLESAPQANEAEIELTPSAQDFPQFLGRRRNGIVHGVHLARDWERHPPEVVWRREIGAGWSGFAVVGDYAFTQEQRGPMELVSCYRLATGEPIWRQGNETGFISKVGGDGPRATPTIDDDRVYACGATGLLTCLDADGEVLWQVNALEEVQAENTKWGYAGSPLVLEEFVVVNGGGERGDSLLAYDKRDGKLVWRGGEHGAVADSYSSPALATLLGVEQILQVNDHGLTSVSPEDGETLWRLDWPLDGKGNPKIAQPLVLPGDRILLSWAYTAGTALIQLSESAEGLRPEIVWANRNLRVKFCNIVVRGDFAYGLDDRILTCLDLTTGQRRWKKRSGAYGHGQILLVEDTILALTEDGDLTLSAATPEDHVELGRVPALGDKSWNTLALAAPHLLVRNDRQAMCFRLTLASGEKAETRNPKSGTVSNE